MLIIVDHIDIAGLDHHVKDFCHTDDYKVDIFYAAYWIKNLLSLRKRHFDLFQTQLLLDFSFSACK